MGIIRQQTIKGSIISYIGAILGFINTAILFPRILSTEQIGILTWLIASCSLISQFSSLGFTNITNRLFPYFRDEKKKNNGFTFLLLCVGFIGSLLGIVIFYIVHILNKDESYSSPQMLDSYIYFLIPLIIFSIFIYLFDSYNRVMYDSISGTFFREVVFKVICLISIICYSFETINFHTFVVIYSFAFCLPALLLLILLIKRKQIHLKARLDFIDKKMAKEMLSVSFYGIINSFNDKLANNIDKIMIVAIIGLSGNGIFATMANFGVLVSLPTRSLKRIASIVIAEAWKKNDIETIKSIYIKSSLHQFMAACLLFFGIWLNIDNIIIIIGEKYASGKFVILFIGLMHVVQMLSSVSGNIIQNSKHYRVQTLMLSIYGVLIITTNYIFIPLWGITGAAIASLISCFVFNLGKYIYLLKKYRMQALSKHIVFVAFSALASYMLAFYIPKINIFLIDILLRSSIFAFLYLGILYKLNISEDYNNLVKKILKFIF